MPFQKGHKAFPGTENTRFKKGMTCWCKGTKGIMKANKTSFTKDDGFVKYDYGKRKYKTFYFGKEKKQIPLSNLVWMKKNNLHRIPPGSVIHHIDGNRENNNIENLQLMTPEFHAELHMAYSKLKREDKV